MAPPRGLPVVVRVAAAVALLAAAAVAQPAPRTAPQPAPRTTPPSAPPFVAPAPVAAADTIVRGDTLRLRAGRGRYFREGGEWVSVLEDGVRLETDSTTIDSRRARAFRSRGLAYFYEDVVVRDGGITMTGDEGEYRRDENLAILRGRVRIRDRHGIIHADRARFTRDDRVAWLWGNVDFRDEQTRVRADSVLYREGDGTGEAFGAVVITDLETGSEAFGSHAIYDRKTGLARLEPEPRMVLREEGSEDTEVRAADLEFDRDRSIVRARGNVRIQRGVTVATADSAFLYRDEDKLLLRGQPVLRREETTMRGREIDVFYKDDEVDRVAVRQAAHLVQTREDTLLVRGANEVRGDSAQLYFDAGELSRAVVVGNASSRFAPAETRTDRVSRNEARADSIVMRFADDEIEEVLFIGNASGTYRFYEGDLEALRRPPQAEFDSTFGVVRGDTTGFDFERRAEPVDYAAETILYMAKQNDLLLLRAAQVRYQGRLLRAGRINYDADTDLLDARERPALDDSGDLMYGDHMGYDLGTREAWIRGGSTQYDMGFYTGRELKKVEEGVLQVRHASYTTCDLAQPHYRFECDRMKIYLRKKIVGRSVGVYLGQVPIFWVPFIYNSTDTGRHSGFLQPDIEFGVGGQQRFVRGLQYYWAASTYYDFLFSADYLERLRPDRSSVAAVLATPSGRSMRFGASARYKVRYKLDGNIDYSFRRSFGDDATSFSYLVTGRHEQSIDERTRLSGTVDYASSNTAVRDVNSIIDYQRSLERNLNSGLTFTRRSDLASISASVQRRELLNPAPRFRGTLVSWRNPDLRVTFRSIRLAPAPADPRRQRTQAFLHSLQLNPFVNFGRSSTTSRVLRDAASLPDSGSAPEDSFTTRQAERTEASTALALSRQARLGPLSLSPSVSYSENYLKDSTQPNLERHSRRVSTGLGSATTVYGLFYPNRFNIAAVRHRIEPRASLNFIPEIGGQQRRSTSVGLSLNNTLDAKIGAGDTARRVDGLLAWSLSTAYNPTTMGAPGQAGAPGEPDRKFQNINSTITINRSGPLRLTITQTYDPYRGRILSTSVPFALRIGGRFGYGETGIEPEERNRVIEEQGEVVMPDSTADSTAVEPLSGRPDADAAQALSDLDPVAVGGAGDLTWGLSLGYTLVRNEGRTQSARVPLTFRIQPTRNWEVSFGTTYDGTTRELGQPSIRITRDLHCWKASFTRIRTFSTGSGGEWQYYFRIFVDRHPDDLFIESGDRSYGYGY